MPNPISLLKFQIGPVQEFIAQARSTRDLWSASYLLSWLAAKGILELRKTSGTELIFPSTDRQPMLDLENAKKESDQTKLLTPNLPNIFIAAVRSDQAEAITKEVKTAIEREVAAIAKACFTTLQSERILTPKQRDDFINQAHAYFSISWTATPMGSASYAECYKRNGTHLDAVRQTRDFKPALKPTHSLSDKDSITGIHPSLVRPSDEFRKSLKNDAYRQLFKHDDHLGAITLIKRVWHLAYLKDMGLRTSSTEFPIRSTRAIAARSNERDDVENTDTAQGEKYLAVIAFDGDSIGKWVNGDDLTDVSDLRQHHENFSKALSTFALGSARETVEKHKGFLIYAGGDDVLALTMRPSSALRNLERPSLPQLPRSKTKTATPPTPPPASPSPISKLHSKISSAKHRRQKNAPRTTSGVRLSPSPC